MSLLGRFDPLGYFIYLPDVEKGHLTEALSQPEDFRGSERAKRVGVLFHEYAHFVQIASTPFGQFWTRSLCAQGGFARLVLKDSVKKYQRVQLRLPIISYCEEGSRAGEAFALCGIVVGWASIDTLLKGLVSGTPTELHELLPEANRAFRLVIEWGYTDRGVPNPPQHTLPVVSTNLEADSLSLPETEMKLDTLSTSNLLEVHAHIAESRVISQYGTPEDEDDVARRSDTAGHSKVLQVMGAYHDQVIEYTESLVRTTLALIELALFAPLDPHWSAEWSRHLLWEDIHPAYRFVKAASLTQQIGLLESDDNYEAFQNQICRALGWPTPRKIMTDLLPALDQSPSVYDRFAGECFRIRLRTPAVFSFAEPKLNMPIPLMIYRDGAEWVSLPFYPDDGHIGPLLTHYLGREMANQMLFNGMPKLPVPANLLGRDTEEVLSSIFNLTRESLLPSD